MVQSYLYFFCIVHLDYSEKQCSSAFWNGELEDELRELGKLDCFGLLKTNEDREKVMTEVDKIRAKSVYPHSAEDCSETYKTRGKFTIFMLYMWEGMMIFFICKHNCGKPSLCY